MDVRTEGGVRFDDEVFAVLLGAENVITEKYIDAEHFVEIGHVVPAQLDNVTSHRLFAFVAQVLEALGVRYGPTHTEVVLTDSGPHVIETHVRPGGDGIGGLIERALGVDLDLEAARTVLELGVSEAVISLHPRCAAATWFLSSGEQGILDRVAGVEAIEVNNVPGVRSPGGVDAQEPVAVSLTIDVAPGTAVCTLRSSADRIGNVVTVAADSSEAIELARSTIGRLSVVLRKAADGTQ